MTDILRPDNRQYVDDVLAQIKSRQSVYVEGPTGSGRGTMLDALREAGGVVLELLALEESDASAVALLEMYSWSSADLQLSRGTDAEAYSAAFQALRALAGHEGAFLVARLPASWKLLERQVDTDDAVPRRARAVFNALLHSELPIVLIADAAIRCSDLGFHPSLRITLPPHEVPLSALGSIEWEAYERSFAALSEAAPELRASPLTWRLAIGLVGLGARPAAVVSQLPRLSLLELARKVGRWIWSRWPALLDRLSLFQAIRRPV